MRAIITLLLPLLILSTFGCSTRSTLDIVKIKKGTKLAKLSMSDKGEKIVTNYLRIYECKESTEAIINLKDKSIEIELIAPSLDTVSIGPFGDLFKTPSNKFLPASRFTYHSVLSADNPDMIKARAELISSTLEDSVSLSGMYFYDNKILYRSRKPIFQALSIPFKLRNSKDDFPSSVSTGFNAGIALGYNWDFHRTRPILLAPENKMIGYKTSKFSFVLAPFLGLTSVGLTPANTQQDIQLDQSVLGISTGATAAVKINSFTIGPAVGFDWGLKNSNKWVYQGSMWVGIVVGIDTFK